MRADWTEQRLYRLIFEHSTEATVVVDDDGRVLLANRAARSLRGVEVEQLFRWSAERGADLVSFRAQLRVGGRATGEVQVRGPDRKVRHVALEGRAHGPLYVVTVLDVTERRAEEEEVRHLRRLETLGFMTASVVHDFNNVLTAMVCSASLLARALPAEDEAPAALARGILDAGDRAAGLVRRLLRTLRREATPPERVNLNTVIEEARGLVELVVGKSIAVNLNLDAALGDTLLERERLDHLLLNLAANARDAMPRGGTLTISTANLPMVEEGAHPAVHDGAYVALVVSDTGAGMSPEALERVFERFFTTKEAGRGTGLGLASAQCFVTQSGGVLSVRSAPGQGTSVVIYLPRAAPAPAVSGARDSLPEPAGGGEAIVVVESDDHVRLAIRSALSERGYRVLDAPTGELALRQSALADLRIDLVLADVGAPGLTGAEVAQQLQARGHAPRLLLMSGLADRDLDDRGVDSDTVLRKAFTTEALARAVRQALGDGARAPEATAAS